MIELNTGVFVYSSLGLLFFHNGKRSLRIPQKKFHAILSDQKKVFDFITQNSDMFKFGEIDSLMEDIFGTKI